MNLPKIISRSEYESLIQFRDEYETLETRLRILNREHEQYKYNAAFDFSIRRAIIGMKGCGKTTLLKNKIIPKLKNYFLIDVNNEYDTVPADKKFVVDRKMGISERKKKIIDAIRDNSSKVVIIEDVGCLHNNLKWLSELFFSDTDFIIVSSSNNMIKEWINLNIIKSIYAFDVLDWDNYFYEQYRDKYVLLTKSDWV